MNKTTLIIMAAGVGSRYGGSKQIDGIGPNGEMLMQYSVYDAARAGFERIVFIIKPEHREIIERLFGGKLPPNVDMVYQDYSSLPAFYTVPNGRVKPFGTVHAVLCAKKTVDGPFAVINADDFYGADAFSVMRRALLGLSEGEAVMVAYKLKNTVIGSGAVTRGICRVENGSLRSVTEAYRVTATELGAYEDEVLGALDGETPVSMNMWGFLPSFFDIAEKRFSEFLVDLDSDELNAEYALPTLVDRMISDGDLRTKVLTTDSIWYGVTYKEDKSVVSEQLLKMHNEGKYPRKLF